MRDGNPVETLFLYILYLREWLSWIQQEGQFISTRLARYNRCLSWCALIGGVLYRYNATNDTILTHMHTPTHHTHTCTPHMHTHTPTCSPLPHMHTHKCPPLTYTPHSRTQHRPSPHTCTPHPPSLTLHPGPRGLV